MRLILIYLRSIVNPASTIPIMVTNKNMAGYMIGIEDTINPDPN